MLLPFLKPSTVWSVDLFMLALFSLAYVASTLPSFRLLSVQGSIQGGLRQVTLRPNSTGPANMIRETLHAPEGANTLGAAGYLDLFNKILLAIYFQDLKLHKTIYSCFHVMLEDHRRF